MPNINPAKMIPGREPAPANAVKINAFTVIDTVIVGTMNSLTASQKPAKPANPHPNPKLSISILSTLIPKSIEISLLSAEALIALPIRVLSIKKYIRIINSMEEMKASKFPKLTLPISKSTDTRLNIEGIDLYSAVHARISELAIKIPRPNVKSKEYNSGWPLIGLIKATYTKRPKKKEIAGATKNAIVRLPVKRNVQNEEYPAKTTNSPWDKFTIFMTPNINDKPSARSA